MQKHTVDLNAVAPEHRAVDQRLANWGRWCSGGWGAPSSCPMFRLMPPQPKDRADAPWGVPLSVDSRDASLIASAVQALPEKHRHALNWFYVRPGSPRRVCQALGVNPQGLRDLLETGRAMLVNRGV